MPNPEEVTEFVLAATHGVVDELIDFIRTGPVGENDGQRDRALIDATRALDDVDPRRENEGHAALSLLHAALAVVLPHEPDPDEIDPRIGFERLANGDRNGALAIADDLQQQAGRTATDDWNYGNLIHDAHIIRGKVFLADGDLDASATELLAAGDVDGSPQLNSFGPDLSLAWSLMKCGRPDAALAYFQRVAKFWEPHERA